IALNDRTMRMVGIPLFGVVIPNITGLFGHLGVQHLTYWLGYLYFILLSAAIWHGNRYLMFRTRRRFTWFDRPIEKIILLVFNNVFFTTPLTVAWLCCGTVGLGFPPSIGTRSLQWHSSMSSAFSSSRISMRRCLWTLCRTTSPHCNGKLTQYIEASKYAPQ